MAYTVSNINYDYALADLPFLSASSREHPVERALAEVRKQQFDNSSEPGDQSLSQWWLRSQTDWSGGAGQDYMEPASDEWAQRRYYRSHGVDTLSNPGEFKLLRTLSSSYSTAGTTCQVVVEPSSGYLLYSVGASLMRYSPFANFTGESGSTITQLTLAGNLLLVTDSTGAIYSGSPTGTTVASLWTTASGASKSYWVKERVITTQGQDVLELDLVGGDMDTVTPLYTHPDSSWTWLEAFEGPNAVYVAGYGTSGSAIVKFELDTSGALPTLSGGATTVATFPKGENITSVAGYLGTYVIVASTSGVRVGTINADSSITLGPISWPSAYTASGIKVFGRNAFIMSQYRHPDDVGGTKNYCVIRFDLSQMDDDGRVAWMTDQETGNSTYTPLAFEAYGSSLSDSYFTFVCAFTSGGNVYLFLTDNSTYVTSGQLTTSGIRYGTLEDKYFHSIRVEHGTSGNSTVDIPGVQDNVTSNTDYAIGDTAVSDSYIIEINRGADGGTRTVTGYQVRALPSVTRQRLLRYPLLCFDFEKDKSGVEHGYEGQALSRLQALETAVEDGTPVTWQDLNTGETLSVVVESLSFSQTAPPANASGFGGVAEVVMRTV